jgi:hypothetical protein
MGVLTNYFYYFSHKLSGHSLGWRQITLFLCCPDMIGPDFSNLWWCCFHGSMKDSELSMEGGTPLSDPKYVAGVSHVLPFCVHRVILLMVRLLHWPQWPGAKIWALGNKALTEMHEVPWANQVIYCYLCSHHCPILFWYPLLISLDFGSIVSFLWAAIGHELISWVI